MKSARLQRVIALLPAQGCVLWPGRVDPDGYGRVTVASRDMGAHRAVYITVKGPLPVGLELDHLCRVRLCVNPDHLEPVTHAENVRRSWPALKTECANGHPYDEANTYIRPTGQRDCRRCTCERQQRYQARKRAA